MYLKIIVSKKYVKSNLMIKIKKRCTLVILIFGLNRINPYQPVLNTLIFFQCLQPFPQNQNKKIRSNFN